MLLGVEAQLRDAMGIMSGWGVGVQGGGGEAGEGQLLTHLGFQHLQPLGQL